MLDRLVGNAALKQQLTAALQANHLPHAILLVGEPGCGVGFAARCLAADYLYPQGGPHAEAVLRGQDSECLALRGEGASGQIAVQKVREARAEIQHSALSTDAAGRVLFVYGAQNLNEASANALLKIIEEPPAGVVFVFTATSAATVLPTIRSRCAAYTVAPVPRRQSADWLRAAHPNLTPQAADDLAFLYEGHLGNCRRALTDADAKAALTTAKTLCSYAQKRDTYLALALLTAFERDKAGLLPVLWQLDQLCSAVLRAPAFGERCGGLEPARAAVILQATGQARRALEGNGNTRLVVALLAAGVTAGLG